MKVAALAGGVGGAKLLVGLQRVLSGDLTAIVNTGDDAVIYGVHVSPDVDIVTYWLAGIADTDRGWGVAGDTFTVMDALAAMGEDAWFRLGDRDLATCLHRTQRLRAGQPLSSITADVAASLGAQARVVPMSDDEMRTRVVTADGRTLDFQEYFVREDTAPEVTEVRFTGIADATPAPGVLDAIATAECVIVCPSNPVLSIGPIVAVPGVRDALRTHPSVVAVSPIVGGVALKGPADRILKSLGHDPSATGVAAMYADFVTAFALDVTDEHDAGAVAGLGVRPIVAEIVMSDHDASERLARVLLEGP